MKKCWKLVPTDRSQFTALVHSLGKILAAVAGYVELSMTLLPPEAEAQYDEIGPHSVTGGMLNHYTVIPNH